MGLENKVILVTGATGGLGRIVVRHLWDKGAVIIGTYHRESSLQSIADEVVRSDRFTALQANLTDEAEVKTLAEKIRDKYKRLDHLVNLAGGFWMGGLISETPTKQWQRMMDMNLHSSFLVGRAAFKLMQKNGGHILNIAAKPALELTPGMGAYAVSKAALIAMTEIMAKEGKAFDIRANYILPGVIDTTVNREAMPDADFSKWVTPDEIAEAIISLCENKGISAARINMFGKI